MKCPRGPDRIYVYDRKVPRLAFCITAKGARSFYLCRRVNGNPQRVRLGGFPEISVELARSLAEQTNAEIAKGKDPQASKKAKRGETTFAELFAYYLEQAKAHKKTWKEDEEKFNIALKDLHNRKLSEITRSHITALHLRTAKKREREGWKNRKIGGPGAANHLLALISAVFNKAPDLGFQGPNPARGIRKFPKRERDRFLHPDELPQFFKAVREEANSTVRDFFFVALFTGARRANVAAMRWDQVNLGRRTWGIPETKTGEPQTVHLPPPAVGILEERRQAANGEWVFPGRGKTGHVVEPKLGWQRVLRRAKIENLRIHDLRRTLGSWEAGSGATSLIIGKTLGHKEQSTTAIYARLDLAPVRDAVDKATAAMLAAAEDGGKTNGS